MRVSNCTRFIPLLVLLLLPVPSFADSFRGRVVRIADGDTVTVLDSSSVQYKIRLMGIDAPEKKQAFGQRSKEHLSDLVFDKQVTIESSKKDRYGRIVGKITVNGVDANLEQIKAGFAWHYKQYQKEQSPADRTAYADAEVEARARHVGLWAAPDQTPPWEFRHK